MIGLTEEKSAAAGVYVEEVSPPDLKIGNLSAFGF